MYKIIKAQDRFIILKSKIERRWFFKKIITWHMIDEYFNIINYPCTVKFHADFDSYEEAEMVIKKNNLNY
jgi:hypothetical protein